jgi:hypothetical protein
MADTPAILDWVSIDYLTNTCRLVIFFGASLEVINLHHVPLLPKPYRPYTHRQRRNRGGGGGGHMPYLALPLLYLMYQISMFIGAVKFGDGR